MNHHHQHCMMVGIKVLCCICAVCVVFLVEAITLHWIALIDNDIRKINNAKMAKRYVFFVFISIEGYLWAIIGIKKVYFFAGLSFFLRCFCVPREICFLCGLVRWLTCKLCVFICSFSEVVGCWLLCCWLPSSTSSRFHFYSLIFINSTKWNLWLKLHVHIFVGWQIWGFLFPMISFLLIGKSDFSYFVF